MNYLVWNWIMRSLQHLAVRETDADGRPGVCKYTQNHLNLTLMKNQRCNETQLVSRDILYGCFKIFILVISVRFSHKIHSFQADCLFNHSFFQLARIASRRGCAFNNDSIWEIQFTFINYTATNEINAELIYINMTHNLNSTV